MRILLITILLVFSTSAFSETTEVEAKVQLDIGGIIGNGLQNYYDARLFQPAGDNSLWPSVANFGNTAVVTGIRAPELLSEENIDPTTGLPVENFFLRTSDQGMRAPINPGSPVAVSNSYTQQVWVRIRGINTFNGIMDFSPNESYAMYWEDSPLPGFIYMSETGSTVSGRGRTPAGTGTVSAPWINVAITFFSTGVESTSQLNIYINGVLADTVTGGNGIGPAARGNIIWIDLLTSASDSGTEFGFEGDAAIMMLYNRSLSAPEIFTNYEAQAGRFGLSGKGGSVFM